MDSSAEKPEHQRDAVLTHRNSYKADGVNVGGNSSRMGPQRRPPAQNEGLGRIAQLKNNTFQMLGTLYTTVVPFLALLLICFFGLNIFRSTVNLGCKFPNTSYLPTCQYEGSGNEAFDVIVCLQSQLVSVQEIIVKGTTLPMLFDNSKIVVREVVHIVRKSKLPSRYHMVEHLIHYWQLTDATSNGIGDLLDEIDRTMDSVITRNELILDNLKQIASSFIESHGTTQLIFAILFNTPITIEDAVQRQYLKHLNDLIVHIDNLLIDSQSVELDLKQMADIKWDLRDLIVDDHKEITYKTYDARGTFWVWFGRHRGLLKELKQHADVFPGLDAQHIYAIDLINDVTEMLQTIRFQLGDLRTRTQEPVFNMAGDLQLQIEFMEKGIDTLKTGRAKSSKAKQETLDDVDELIAAQKEGGK